MYNTKRTIAILLSLSALLVVYPTVATHGHTPEIKDEILESGIWDSPRLREEFDFKVEFDHTDYFNNDTDTSDREYTEESVAPFRFYPDDPNDPTGDGVFEGERKETYTIVRRSVSEKSSAPDPVCKDTNLMREFTTYTPDGEDVQVERIREKRRIREEIQGDCAFGSAYDDSGWDVDSESNYTIENPSFYDYEWIFPSSDVIHYNFGEPEFRWGWEYFGFNPDYDYPFDESVGIDTNESSGVHTYNGTYTLSQYIEYTEDDGEVYSTLDRDVTHTANRTSGVREDAFSFPGSCTDWTDAELDDECGWTGSDDYADNGSSSVQAGADRGAVIDEADVADYLLVGDGAGRSLNNTSAVASSNDTNLEPSGESVTDDTHGLHKYTGGDSGSFLVELTTANTAGAATPADVVFVLDRSGSMLSPKIDQAKTALNAVYADFKAYDDTNPLNVFRAGLATFNHREQVNAFLAPIDDSPTFNYSEIDPCGCTGIGSGLKNAIDKNDFDDNATPVIVLASDGIENRTPYLFNDGQDENNGTFVEDIEDAENGFRGGTNPPTFYTIGVGSDEGEGASGEWEDRLTTVAETWGTGDGSYYEIPDWESLGNIYTEIADLYTGEALIEKIEIPLTMTENFTPTGVTAESNHEVVSSEINGKTITVVVKGTDSTDALNPINRNETIQLKVDVDVVADPTDTSGNAIEVIDSSTSKATVFASGISADVPFGANDPVYAQIVPEPDEPLEISCNASPSTVDTEENVTWTATASGGEAPYSSYSWTGAVNGEGSSITESFASPGEKTATVTVTDDLRREASGSCSVTVEDPDSDPGTLSCSLKDPADGELEINGDATWCIDGYDPKSGTTYTWSDTEEGSDPGFPNNPSTNGDGCIIVTYRTIGDKETQVSAGSDTVTCSVNGGNILEVFADLEIDEI